MSGRKPTHYLLTIFLVFSSNAFSQANVRIATYNIEHLSVEVSQEGNRLQKLKEVIELLDADVIGLQEIADRNTLKKVFPPSNWHLVIDDESANSQDVALAVRKPFSVKGFSNSSLNAEDQHFLFPGSNNNSSFPNRRDLLAIEVAVPNSSSSFFVIVHHAKSRFENDPNKGRATNDFRREMTSKMIVQKLETEFHEKNFVLLGDFNDNPDDRSLNILETGDPNAPARAEEDDGPFLLNLTERLCAAGHVSHGRNSQDIVNETINTFDLQSRDRNNQARGTNQNTGDILFDQILVPMQMANNYVQSSCQVFNRAVAVEGNSSNRASDHLPVFADFVFGDSEDSPSSPTFAGVFIVGLLPDPIGDDRGNETVTLQNTGSSQVNLTGWSLKDNGNNQCPISGTIQANDILVITMTSFEMPLNNTGDQVTLLDNNGILVHQISYVKKDVKPGLQISF